MIEYEHTQPGTLIRVMMGAMLVVFFLIGISLERKGESSFAMLLAAAVLLICLVLFHSLTVRVTSNDVSLTFGIGLIQKSFLVSDIERVSAVKTRWYQGWGIKKIWGGWLFNVSGFDAVQLTMQDGRVYRIGTDQPRELLAMIEQAISSMSGQHRAG